MLRRILDSAWTYFILAGLLVLVGLFSALVEIQVPSRDKGTAQDLLALRDRDDINVIFILIDTLRSDHLGSYGYERPTSPVMDELANYGIRFANVEAQSTWTKASMASLWTGIMPPRTGVTRFDHAMPDRARLPAEILRDAGYRTVGIWRNGWVAPNFGFHRGFQDYVRPKIKPTMEKIKRVRPGQSLAGTDEDITDAAKEFIRTHANDKFFLYLHYMDIHQYAYDQKAAELGFGTDHVDAYDGAIHWTDRNVGAVLAELEYLDIFNRTVVVIASDHGEAFFEHDLEGHARTLYQEVSQVPLIVIPPFILDPGVVVEPLVRNVDIWPTILDLLGLEPLQDADGRSLVDLIVASAKGEAPTEEPAAIAYIDQNWGQMQLEPNPLVSIRKDGKRVIFRPTNANHFEAFDHAQDPTEQENLAKGEAPPPEWADAMREEGMAFHELEPAWGDAPEVVVDDMYKEQLRALGYVVK